MLIFNILLSLIRNFDPIERIKFTSLVLSSVFSSFVEILIIFLVINGLRLAVNQDNFYLDIFKISISLNIYIVIVIFLVATSAWYRYKHLYWITKFSYKYSVKLSNKLFLGLLSRPFLFYKNSKSSELIDLLVIKNNTLGPLVILPAIKWIAGVAMFIIMALASIAFLGYGSMLGVLFVMSLFFLFGLKTKSTKKINANLISKFNPLILGVINQAIHGFRDVKLNRMEGLLLNKFTGLLSDRSEVQVSSEMVTLGPKIIIESLIFSVLLVFIFYLISGAENKSESFLLIGLIALSIQKFIPIAQQIYSSNSTLRLNSKIFAEVTEFIQFSLVLSNTNLFRSSFNNFIKFENVSYKYPDGKEVIKDLSVKFCSGDLVAISGKSGAGKSTFLDLFIGFLPPTSGRIIADNLPIDKSFGATNVAYVPQKNYIFDGNFVENIALGVDPCDVDYELFFRAIKIAQLYNHIQSLSQKEFTNLGEDGALMSGGLRQRVGIARALYMNRPILLLDEATSALDNETENLLFNELFDYCKKSQKLCIMVTHKVDLLSKFQYSYIFKNKNLHNWCN